MGVVFLSAVGLEMFTADNVVSREIFTPGGDTEISSVIGCRTSHTPEKSTWNCRKKGPHFKTELLSCFNYFMFLIIDNDNM